MIRYLDVDAVVGLVVILESTGAHTENKIEKSIQLLSKAKLRELQNDLLTSDSGL
jgi:hypothetical protein